MDFVLSEVDNQIVYSAVDDVITGIEFGVAIALLFGC